VLSGQGGTVRDQFVWRSFDTNRPPSRLSGRISTAGKGYATVSVKKQP